MGLFFKTPQEKIEKFKRYIQQIIEIQKRLAQEGKERNPAYNPFEDKEYMKYEREIRTLNDKIDRLKRKK